MLRVFQIYYYSQTPTHRHPHIAIVKICEQKFPITQQATSVYRHPRHTAINCGEQTMALYRSLARLTSQTFRSTQFLYHTYSFIVRNKTRTSDVEASNLSVNGLIWEPKRIHKYTCSNKTVVLGVSSTQRTAKESGAHSHTPTWRMSQRNIIHDRNAYEAKGLR
jgi:hypothetical protein